MNLKESLLDFREMHVRQLMYIDYMLEKINYEKEHLK